MRSQQQQRTTRLSGTQQLGNTQRMTKAAYHQTLERRRNEEYLRNDMLSYHRKTNITKASHHSDDRVERLRWQRRFQHENQELRQGMEMEKAERERRQRELLQQQDEQLARVLRNMKNQELADRAERLRIVESSHELQELRSKLTAAKTNQVRATQLVERRVLHLQQQQADAQHQQKIDAYQQAAKDKQDLAEAQRIREYLKGRDILKEQMAERREKRRQAYQMHLQEKAMVDEIAAAIQREDREKLVALQKKRAQLKQDIRTYLDSRAKWHEQERQRELREMRQIREYQELQERRMQALSQKKQSENDLQDRVLARLTAEIEAERQQKEEMREMLDELYWEEAERRAMADEKARKDRLARMKQEMLHANAYQRAMRAEKEKQQAEEEARIRQEMMKKFEEDERLAAMNNERKRREMLNYRTEIDRLLQDRRELYEQARAEEEAERARHAAIERYRQQVIEEERQRLLKEHARGVKHFLPKGVIRDQKDYKTVFDGSRQSTPVQLTTGGNGLYTSNPLQGVSSSTYQQQQQQQHYRQPTGITALPNNPVLANPPSVQAKQYDPKQRRAEYMKSSIF